MSNAIDGRESSEREHYAMTHKVQAFMLTDEGQRILADDYDVIEWAELKPRLNYDGEHMGAPFLFRLLGDDSEVFVSKGVRRVVGHVVMPDKPQSIQFTVLGLIPFDDFDSLPQYALDGQTFYFCTIEGGFALRELPPAGGRIALHLRLLATTICKSPADSMPDFLIPSLARIRGCHHALIEWDNQIMTEQPVNRMTDKIEFIETWKDTRDFKTVDLTSASNPQFFHEYARCEVCNGEIEFLLGQKIIESKAEAFKCLHCKQPSSLLKRTWQALNGGE